MTTMQPWKVRRVAPHSSDWATVAAETAVDAAQTYHMRSGMGCYLRRTEREAEDFALVEVEGFGQVVSRCFFAGASRDGAAARDLRDVARRLGVPVRLLEGHWEGERADWQPRYAQ